MANADGQRTNASPGEMWWKLVSRHMCSRDGDCSQSCCSWSKKSSEHPIGTSWWKVRLGSYCSGLQSRWEGEERLSAEVSGLWGFWQWFREQDALLMSSSKGASKEKGKTDCLQCPRQVGWTGTIHMRDEKCKMLFMWFLAPLNLINLVIVCWFKDKAVVKVSGALAAFSCLGPHKATLRAAKVRFLSTA